MTLVGGVPERVMVAVGAELPVEPVLEVALAGESPPEPPHPDSKAKMLAQTRRAGLNRKFFVSIGELNY
jgi:hypothetical protein